MAQQACYNVGKRLLTNAEWQAAAAGTPDPGLGADPAGMTTCNTNHALGTDPGSIVDTGSSEGQATECVSNWGIIDMVGNIAEWTADWMLDNGPRGDNGSTGPVFGNDRTNVGGTANAVGADGTVGGANNGQVGNSTFPAAVLRGGDTNDQDFAGVFSIDSARAPSHTSIFVGFRCAI